MKPKSREALYKKMCSLRREGKLDFAVAFSSALFIDRRGIVPAVQSALDRALAKVVKIEPCYYEVLLDGGLHAPKEFTSSEDDYPRRSVGAGDLSCLNRGQGLARPLDGAHGTKISRIWIRYSQRIWNARTPSNYSPGRSVRHPPRHLLHNFIAKWLIVCIIAKYGSPNASQSFPDG